MTGSFFRQLRPSSGALAASASLAVGLVCLAAPGLSAQVSSSAAVADATRLMASGRDYRATRLLLTQLSTPLGRQPEVLLLAARAASGWSGWGTIVRLLGREAWLDSYADGAGRAILARARVERAEDAAADARSAVATAPRAELGQRVVTLARAFDRAGLLDSAAAAYRRAAGLLPSISDWLLLRAAGVTADSSDRAALYREVALPAAVPRIRWTEALARDRTGDRLGAARAYESLGAAFSALLQKLDGPSDSTSRAALRGALVAALVPTLSPEDSRAAIEILDREFPPLRRAEELAVARRAAVADRLTRAALGFARAAPLADADRFTYGTVLARLGRHREAIAIFESIHRRELLARSRYQRARSLLRIGTRQAAMVALRKVLDSPPEDSATAAIAGFLRADLLVDSGDDGAARDAYLEVARRFPGTGHGSRAAFQAALIRYLRGDPRGAEREFTALTRRPGDRTELSAATYWSGRALLSAGDSAGARTRWQGLIDRFPQSYYAVPAANRLGIPPIVVMIDSLPPPDNGAQAALARGAFLDRLGLRVEARFEYDQVSRNTEVATSAWSATAVAFSAGGCLARAYRLATRAGDVTPSRILFPLPQSAGFLQEAREAKVDPLLAAALVRQESGFDAGAHSAADARGLMQVLPGVGAALARADGLREWDGGLLYEPEINLRFGLQHLAQGLRRFSSLESALAGYNAGTRAAEGWLALPGAREDPEVYIERIQFAETRDYVRRILRNLAVYRALYPEMT